MAIQSLHCVSRIGITNEVRLIFRDPTWRSIHEMITKQRTKDDGVEELLGTGHFFWIILSCAVWHKLTNRPTDENERLYRRVWNRLIRKQQPVNDRLDRYLEETEADYRAGLVTDFPVLALVLSMVAICLVMTSCAVSAVGFAFWPMIATVLSLALALVLVLSFWIWYLDQRASGRLLSDAWSKGLQKLLRFHRVLVSDRRLITSTILSEIINECLAIIDNPEEIKPLMTPTVRGVNDTLIVTSSLTDIRERLLNRPGLVLGLSGTRGVGKTIALRYLERFEFKLGHTVMIHLPSSADASDLPRYLVERVAESFSGWRRPEAIQRARTRSRYSLAISFVLAIVGLIVMMSSAIPGVSIEWQLLIRLRSGHWLAVALCAVSFASLCYSYVSALWGGQRGGSRYMSILAKEILAGLRYEEERHNNVTFGPQYLPLSASFMSTKKRRPSASFDALAAFERLTSHYGAGRESGKQIVLLIDELDRFGTSNDVKMALNAIKPMLAVPGVSAVLTISTEARADFGKRNDVLDSTFDEVVSIRSWSMEESRQLFLTLTVGLPPLLVEALCAATGGRPREMSRVAWQVTRLRRGQVPLEFVGLCMKPVSDGTLRTWMECLRLVVLRMRIDASCQADATGDLDEVLRIVAERTDGRDGRAWYRKYESVELNGIRTKVAELREAVISEAVAEKRESLPGPR